MPVDFCSFIDTNVPFDPMRAGGAPFHCDRVFKNPQVKYQILSSPPTLRVGGVY